MRYVFIWVFPYFLDTLYNGLHVFKLNLNVTETEWVLKNLSFFIVIELIII
jgi:hypothetical protein